MLIDLYINKEKFSVRFVYWFFQDLFSALKQNQCLEKKNLQRQRSWVSWDVWLEDWKSDQYKCDYMDLF